MANDGERRRAESAQLVRQWGLVRLLATSGRAFSVKELAERLGVSKPTIQRDLATLEHHFALTCECEGKQKKRYRVAETIWAQDAGGVQGASPHAGRE